MTGGWFCCCGAGCWSFSDSFCCATPQYHCDPYPNLGVYWEPLPVSSPTGNWWVDGDYCLLIEDGTPGAIIRNTPCVPAGPENLANRSQCSDTPPNDCDCLESAAGYTGWCTPYMQGSVSIVEPVTDASWSLLLRMKDEDNYLEGKLIWDASENVYAQIWKKIAGVETLLKECGPTNLAYASGKDASLTMCITDDKIFLVAVLGEVSLRIIPEAAPPDIECGFHGGLKHGNSVQTYFTNFSVGQLNLDHVDCTGCGTCVCQSEPEIKYPLRLLLTIFDQNGNWSGLDGQTIVLEHAECPINEAPNFGGTATDGCLAPRSGGACVYADFDVTLTCGQLMPQLRLNSSGSALTQGCCGIDFDSIATPSLAESSCDPFELVYYYTNLTACMINEPCCSGGNPSPCCTCPPCTCTPPTGCAVSLRIVITEA